MAATLLRCAEGPLGREWFRKSVGEEPESPAASIAKLLACDEVARCCCDYRAALVLLQLWHIECCK